MEEVMYMINEYGDHVLVVTTLLPDDRTIISSVLQQCGLDGQE